MWRCGLLGIVLAGVLAGCSLGGGSGAGSTRARSTNELGIAPRFPYHSVIVVGTGTFRSGELGVPLTVHCPQSGATGFQQVIRSPWWAGKITYFGGSASGGGMTFGVGQSGTVRITC